MSMTRPFMTLDDGTEIAHSEMSDDGRVMVFITKPEAGDNPRRAACRLPEYEWLDAGGFPDDEIARYEDIIRSTAHLIIRCSRECRPEDTAGFKVGSYCVYFRTDEARPLEPIHVYISHSEPREGAPKVWITSRGKCVLADSRTELAENALRKVMAVIEARSDEVIAKWKEAFGEVRFYC